MPDLNLVVVTVSEWYVDSQNAKIQEQANLDLIAKFCLPSTECAISGAGFWENAFAPHVRLEAVKGKSQVAKTIS